MASPPTMKAARADKYSQDEVGNVSMPTTASYGMNHGFTNEYNISEKIAWVITEVEYYFDQDPTCLLATSGGRIQFGLAGFSDVGMDMKVGPGAIGLLDFNDIAAHIVGNAGEYLLTSLVVARKDFSNRVGGGILIHPKMLRVWCRNITAVDDSYNLFATVQYTRVILSEPMYKEIMEELWTRNV